MAQHNEVGKIGEVVTAKHMQRLGHEVLEMNYLRKFGEIDLVTHETNRIHFIEVKSVSYETKQALNVSVSRGTYRPEENVHVSKLRKLSNTIGVWLEEHNWEGEWQLDVASVRMVPAVQYAEVEMIWNVIVG